jgi:tyrosine-protein kinase Etk/Wzc
MQEFQMVLKNWKKFVIIQLITVIIVIPILLVLPKWYRSSVVFLIQTDKKEFNLNSAISKLLPMGMGLDINIEIQKYISFLKSRNISDRVIDKFDLMKEYKIKYRDDVYRELASNVSFIDNNNGTVTINCIYKSDPQKAADMANYYFEELQSLDLEISQKQTRLFREMLENNYFKRLKNYESLQIEFSKFKMKTGILEIEDQTKLALKTISELELKKLQAEIQLEYLGKIKSENNPDIVSLENQINAYEKKIQDFKGTSSYSNVVFDKIPVQAIDYYKYFINIEIENKIIEFLTIQLEQTKIEETKITSNIVQLDPAYPSQRKIKPKRMSYLISIMFLNMFLTFFYIKYKKTFIQLLK